MTVYRVTQYRAHTGITIDAKDFFEAQSLMNQFTRNASGYSVKMRESDALEWADRSARMALDQKMVSEYRQNLIDSLREWHNDGWIDVALQRYDELTEPKFVVTLTQKNGFKITQEFNSLAKAREIMSYCAKFMCDGEKLELEQ